MQEVTGSIPVPSTIPIGFSHMHQRIIFALGAFFLAANCWGQEPVRWTCHYSEPKQDEHLHLICNTDQFDPVLIPIWAYDYGDGMVEQLMRSALCYKAPYPCEVRLDRKNGKL